MLASNSYSAEQPLWSYVAGLRPELRPHVRIHVQEFRGVRWYLLHDESSGSFCRFNAAAYAFIGRLDGDLSVDEILTIVNAESRMSTDEVLKLLAQLHQIEALSGGLPVGAGDALSRYRRFKAKKNGPGSFNPLSIRVPLLNPDRLLTALSPYTRSIFTRAGWYSWLSCVFLACVVAVANFTQLYAAFSSMSFSTSEIISLVVLFPLLKLFHELAHGLAVKGWGGDVHEAGLMFLIFFPVPYVDATASWQFRNKFRRATVCAAGIMTELFFASVALFLWVLTEPGLVNDLALYVILIGSVSTLLYNGNPLLRFDGYHVLGDLIEIPDLGGRAGRYYVYLFQKYILRLRDCESPQSASGERRWFIIYGFLSPLYRITVLLAICVYLAGKYLVAGIVLACWAIYTQLVKPLITAGRFLVANERLQGQRLRILWAGSASVGVITALLLIPAPLVTRTEGVVWLHDEGRIHAGTAGVITEVVADSGHLVREGESIMQLQNPELEARLTIARLRLLELKTSQASARERSRVEGTMIESDIKSLNVEIAELEKKYDAMHIVSPATGQLVFQDPHGWIGRHVKTGDTLAYVIQDSPPVVRAVLSQQSIGLLRTGLVSTNVMLASMPGSSVEAELIQEVPAGATSLPSTALGSSGGGKVAIDASDKKGLTSTTNVFQIDLALPKGTPTAGVGGRAYIRMIHGREPLWFQWKRSLQQLFLKHIPT